jgi:hypothetical protein
MIMDRTECRISHTPRFAKVAVVAAMTVAFTAGTATTVSAAPTAPSATPPVAAAKAGHGTSRGPATLGVSDGTNGSFAKTGHAGVVAFSTAQSYVGQHYGATGRCGYRICLYWDSNAGGAGIAFAGYYVNNLVGYKFPNNGSGAGQYVKNNAASVEDQGNGEDYVYYNENQTGSVDWLNPQTWGNLVQTWNNEASNDSCC